jgi:uncharacterized protein with FMN-binding domain
LQWHEHLIIPGASSHSFLEASSRLYIRRDSVLTGSLPKFTAPALRSVAEDKKLSARLQLLTMAKTGSTTNKKIANSVVAMSSAAVLAVYSAGYARTRASAEKFEARAAQRRQADPRPARAGSAPESFQSGAQGGRANAPGRAVLPVSGSTRDEERKPNLIASLETPASRPGLPTAPVTPAPAQAQTPVPAAAPQTTAATATPPTAQPTSYSAAPAPAPAAAPVPDHKYVDVSAAPAPAGAGLWKDGTYYGWGFSPHGDIQAEVYIEGGRIVVASISDCRTRYSCSVIDKLPPQVARRQSAEVDYVTGATESAEAFYDAVKEALSKAK